MVSVVVIKRLILLVLSGAVGGREPQVAAITAVDRVVLPAHTATMDDCCRLQELLLGAPVAGHLPLTSGVMEIISTVELAVTALSTKNDGAIDVQVMAPKRSEAHLPRSSITLTALVKDDQRRQ